MKKSLLALAVLGAFAGVAQAQTNVTLYGLVDLGVRYTDDGSDDENWTMENGQSASRFGIRGTEDLGGGLKASFVLESGFDADTGNIGAETALNDDDEFESEGNLFSRLAYIGLDGGFGGVRLGRQVTPFKAAVDAIDPFGGAGQNGIYDFTGGEFDGEGISSGDFERRSNQITYLTPNMGGFTAQAAYGFSEAAGAVAGTADASRGVGFQVGYGNGPINVQLGWQNERSGTDDNASATFLGATYDLGVAKIHAGFGQNKLEVAGEDGKARFAMLGATAKFGQGTLLANWIRNDNRELDDGDTDTLALGYSHAISKRTNLYAMGAFIRNGDDAAIEAAEAGDNAKIITVGVRHTF